jgi:methylated-DNA-[protein]-cysteine S-methyltransferase
VTTTAWSEIDTPLGAMRAEALDDGIVRLEFADVGRALPAAPQPWRPLAALQDSAASHPSRLADELSAYFDGRLTDFTVPLAAATGTPFQRAAWAYLRSIPFGQTRTYGQQAAAMGSPTAARAVGGANGSNPLCLVVPCHRVVGSGGSLTGFAAGVERKRWLLDHERAVLAGMTEPGRLGPGRAEPASRATDAVPVGRDPRASRGLQPPRAETARLRFRAQTLDTPSLFA